MSISPVDSNIFNYKLNSLYTKLERFGIFLLFIGLFDAKIFGFEGIFNIASYGIVFFLIIFRWKRCIYVATQDLSLLILFATVVLSFFWADNPGISFDNCRASLRTFLFGVYLAAQYKPKELMQLMLKMFTVALVINIIFSSFVIAIGQPYLAVTMTNNEASWQGLLTHKQYFGRMMAHSSILFLLTALSNKRLRLLYWMGFIVSIVFLILSQSKTAWLLCLLGLTMLPILKLSNFQYKLRTIIYIILVFIIGTIAIVVFGNFETIVVDILRKPPDLNGRLDIWNLAIQSGLKRPWLGYGMGGFWITYDGWSVIKSVPWVFNAVVSSNRSTFHCHNGYIEIFLQIGIIGLILFASNLLVGIKRIINLLHLTKSVEFLWMLIFIITTLLGLVSETLVILTPHTISAIYVAIIISTRIYELKIKNGLS